MPQTDPAHRPRRIAVVGAGISGLAAAYLLQQRHDVHLFEAEAWIGGHTHTVPVEMAGRTYAVDTGFIVYNERAYPNFIALLDRLGVATQPSRMTFSFRSESTGVEWGGTSFDSIFAQRSNLLRPSFWGMLRDVLRFGRRARELLQPGAAEPSLQEYLDSRGYGRAFREQYLIPMGAAIWSADPRKMLEFPARYFVRFFEHHGVLDVRSAPDWRVIQGGSARYVDKLVAALGERVHPSAPISRVTRLQGGGVRLSTPSGVAADFDAVVLATHSDQALRLLEAPTHAEREVLGNIGYQANDVVLHTDARLMPRARAAWSSWNYHTHRDAPQRATVTYWMNSLQSLTTPEPLLVTLNRTGDIDPRRVLQSFTYHHPVYTPDAIRAQARHGEISGTGGVYYCGAYWGYGFHEDGVDSALAACAQIDPGIGGMRDA